MFGRIVAIADVFDALMTKRPYKPALPMDETLTIMRKGSGSHFDPVLLEAFNAVLPEIMRIHEAYADNHGPMTDVEVDVALPETMARN